MNYINPFSKNWTFTQNKPLLERKLKAQLDLFFSKKKASKTVKEALTLALLTDLKHKQIGRFYHSQLYHELHQSTLHPIKSIQDWIQKTLDSIYSKNNPLFHTIKHLIPARETHRTRQALLLMINLIYFQKGSTYNSSCYSLIHALSQEKKPLPNKIQSEIIEKWKQNVFSEYHSITTSVSNSQAQLNCESKGITDPKTTCETLQIDLIESRRIRDIFISLINTFSIKKSNKKNAILDTKLALSFIKINDVDDDNQAYISLKKERLNLILSQLEERAPTCERSLFQAEKIRHMKAQKKWSDQNKKLSLHPNYFTEEDCKSPLLTSRTNPRLQHINRYTQSKIYDTIFSELSHLEQILTRTPVLNKYVTKKDLYILYAPTYFLKDPKNQVLYLNKEEKAKRQLSIKDKKFHTEAGAYLKGLYMYTVEKDKIYIEEKKLTENGGFQHSSFSREPTDCGLVYFNDLRFSQSNKSGHFKPSRSSILEEMLNSMISVTANE